MDRHDHQTHPYPDFKPCDRPPLLRTLLGIGLTLCGRWARDRATGTYQKLHAVVVFYLPVCFLGSYRVVDAGNGRWAFVGKHGLPAAAKLWNVLLCCLIATAVAATLQARPEAKARRLLDAGAACDQAGDVPAATRHYAAVLGMTLLDGNGPEALEAERKLLALAERVFQSADASGCVSLFAELVAMQQVPQRIRNPFPDLAARGDQLAARLEPEQPGAACRLWQMVLTLNPEHPDGQARTTRLARAWTAAAPRSVEAAEHLAAILEAADTEAAHTEIHALLLPLKDRLADGEGARMLGRELLDRGEVAAAYPLLYAYVTPRLEAYRIAEGVYQMLWRDERQAALDAFDEDRAPRAFYDAYDKADETTQSTMLDAYIRAAAERNPRYQATWQALEQAAFVVPLALDLGIALMTRAHALQDAEARADALERAEQVFGAVQHAAADDPIVDLHLAQAKYWLGKYEEGAALLDAYLRRHGHAPKAVLQAMDVLREVGETEIAVTLVHQAYEATRDPQMRAKLAHSMSILAPTIEDTIAWLEKADADDPKIQESLLYYQATLAAEEGDRDRAEKLFRRYIELFEEQSNHNNTALVYQALFRLTHHGDDAARAAELMRKALVLEPEDTVLQNNVTEMQRTGLEALFFAEHGEPRAAELGLSIYRLSSLYNTAEERAALLADLTARPLFRELRANYARQLVLAPKELRIQMEAARFYDAVKDGAGLADVALRFKKAGFTVETLSEFAEVYGDTPTSAADLTRRLADLEEKLQAPDLSARARAFVELKAVNTRAARLRFEPKGDAAELVVQSRAIVGLKPSRAARLTLVHVLLLQTHRTLHAANPGYKALYPAEPAPLTPDAFICLLLAADHPLAAEIRAAAPFREALAAVRALMVDFPRDPSARHWAMLHGTADGPRMRAVIDADPGYRPYAAMRQAAYERDSDDQVAAMLLALMKGDRAEAKALADAFRDYEPDFPYIL